MNGIEVVIGGCGLSSYVPHLWQIIQKGGQVGGDNNYLGMEAGCLGSDASCLTLLEEMG